MVCPSIDDEGPMMIPEAMMCGTPVAAFPTGYSLELITNGVEGYRCQKVDPDELAHGLFSMLRDGKHREMGLNAYTKASRRHSKKAFIANYHRISMEYIDDCRPARVTE